MARLFDATAGNAKAVEDGLFEDLQSGNAGNRGNAEGATARTQPTQAIENPRFRGKSPEQLVEMYTNLEAHSGRLANEIGQQRRALDELLIDKRARDLNQHHATAPVNEIKANELLERPTEVIDSFLQKRVSDAVRPLSDQITRLENTLAGQTFSSNHRDSNQVLQSPDFRAWIGKTNMRQNLAQQAGSGNMAAADALLSEYKEYVASRTNSEDTADAETAKAARLANARDVSLERSTTASDGTKPRGKTYRSSDIIAYKLANPDMSDDKAAALDRLYMEGRVISG